MNLVKQLKKHTKKKGLRWENVFEQFNGCKVVSYSEELEPSIFYNIDFVVYDDDSEVEVFIRKPIDLGENLDEVFEKYLSVNRLNADYRGMNFFLEDSWVTARLFVVTDGDLQVAINTYLNGVEVVREEFAAFPPRAV